MTDQGKDQDKIRISNLSIIIWAADEQFLGQQIFNLLNSRAQRDLLLKTLSHDERSLTVTLTQLTDSPVCLLLHHTRFE